MELRHMRYFRVVAECKSFRRAADVLHIAQPALSRQIHALEQMLGVDLFDRHSRGARLTEAGRVFLEESLRILGDVQAASDRIRRVAQGQIGSIKIAFHEVAARQPYLPSFFHATLESFPDIDLKLVQLSSQLQLEALRAGEIDAGFMFHRPAEDSNLEAILVDGDDYVVAMPRTHRLAKQSKVRLADFRDVPFIMPSQRNHRALYNRIMEACLAGGLVPNLAHEAHNEFAIVNLVAAGVGLAFVNRSFANFSLRDVILCQVEDLAVPVHLELVWRRNDRSPVLRRFIDTVGTSDQVRKFASVARSISNH